MATVHSYLDISTSHIDHADSICLEDAHRELDLDAADALPRVISHAYGFWLRVPDRNEDPDADAARAKTYPTIQGIIEHARKYDCWWVNIDQDASVDPDLPTFEW